MMLRSALLVALLVAFACVSARATTINAVSASRDDVNTALQSASSGDTIVIPANAGSHWTNGITWTAPANVTVQGAGTSATGGGDQTVIIDDYAAGNPLLLIAVSATGSFRMHGITFQSGTGSTKDGGTIRFGGPGAVRLDHCHFLSTSDANYKMVYVGLGIWGVMDHCILDLHSTNAVYIYNCRVDAQGNYEWTQPPDLGSSEFFFIEDNIINGDPSTKFTRLLDSNNAGKVVVRFNTLTDACLAENHGTGHSNDDRGPRAQEIYGNTATSTRLVAPNDEPNNVAVDMQGGTALVWGNSWGNAFKILYKFAVIRSDSGTYAQAPTPTKWGYAGPVPLATGTVNVSGTAVTWASGDHFDTGWPAGTMIYITGASSKAIAGQEPGFGPTCGISSVNSTTSITLTNNGHTGGDLTGATYVVGSTWDGNTDAYGYPAIDQPGRGQGDLLTGDFPSKVNHDQGDTIAWPRQALEPLYIWNNAGGIRHGWGEITLTGNARVQSDRDYYLALFGSINTSKGVPFDGTTGCGWGPIGFRPDNCTAGVAYFATDQGSWNTSSSNPYGVQQNGADGVLYKCTAPNTWTLYYTPYTYPHPLQTGNPIQTGGAGTTTFGGTGTVTIGGRGAVTISR